MTDVGQIEWCEGIEHVLKKEGEQAESLFILHSNASKLSNKYNDYIQIPAIVLQTITGFLSATGGLVPPLALGAFSVFTGILSTLLSYYRFSAKGEGHRLVSQLYLKIYKNLEIELSLPIEQRTSPTKLLQDVRDKLSKISEVAPEIPQSVIDAYRLKFKDSKSSKPLIANGLDEIDIYREAVKVSSPPASKIGIRFENASP